MNYPIKELLAKHNIKMKDIADSLDIKLASVSGALNGHHESRPVKRRLAEMLRMDYAKLEKICRKAA